MSACSNTVSEGAGVVGNGDENADDIIRGDTVAKIDRRVNTGDVAGCICCSNVGDSNSLRNDVRANNRSGWFMMSDMCARELRTRKVSPGRCSLRLSLWIYLHFVTITSLHKKGTGPQASRQHGNDFLPLHSTLIKQHRP